MKIAMMFPGYQSQFVGMGKELYDQERTMQELFEQASSCLDKNFVKLCFASSDAELAGTSNAYTSMFLISAAIAALLKEKGIIPDVVAGFNHGVYAALFAADGLSLPDGLYLLNKFASFYDESLKDAKLSAIHISGLSKEEIDALCAQASTNDEKVFVSIYETPTQHVVAGDANAVDRVRDRASEFSEKREISIEPVDLAVGLHSELVNPVVDQLKMYLNKVDFHDLQIPMIESMNGRVLTQGDDVREQILARINTPINWLPVMHKLADYDLVIEVGPGTTLSKWFAELYPDRKVVSVNTPEDIKNVVALVQPQESAPEQNQE